MGTFSRSLRVLLGFTLAAQACAEPPQPSFEEPCNHYVQRPDSVRDALLAPLRAGSLCAAGPSARWRLTRTDAGATAPLVSYTLHTRPDAADSIAWRSLALDGTELHLDSGGFRIARRDARRVTRLLAGVHFLRGAQLPRECPGCVIECTHCGAMRAELRVGDRVAWYVRPVAAPPIPALDAALQPLRDSLAKQQARRLRREAR